MNYSPTKEVNYEGVNYSPTKEVSYEPSLDGELFTDEGDEL